MTGATLGSVAISPALAEETLDRLDGLLGRYVVAEGVRYDTWRVAEDDARALDTIVDALSSTDPATLAEADRFALYINLYNAKTVQLVLDGNPTKSIRQLSRWPLPFQIFFRKQIDFDGETLSLNGLEKRLREESDDPRIHFAVNCASRSCPPLATEAYRGARLDEQLDRQTRAFLAVEGEIAVTESGRSSRVLQLSKIFDWYADDFAPSGGVLEFLRRYAPEQLGGQLEHDAAIRLTYRKYNWDLNRAR